MANRLKALYGNTEKMIVGDITIIVKSLSLNDLIKIESFMQEKKNMEAMKEVLYIELRNSFPKPEQDPVNGFTNDEIRQEMENIDSKLTLEIFKKVMQLSGISLDDTEKKS